MKQCTFFPVASAVAMSNSCPPGSLGRCVECATTSMTATSLWRVHGRDSTVGSCRKEGECCGKGADTPIYVVDHAHLLIVPPAETDQDHSCYLILRR